MKKLNPLGVAFIIALSIGIIIWLLHIATKIVLFYYILKIENQNCNCIHDWRPKFLKYTLLINLILYTCCAVLFISSFLPPIIGKPLLVICIIIECIIAYSYFTYIRDLKKTNCKCLIGTNKFLYSMRTFVMIMTVLGILVSLIFLKFFTPKQKK